MTLLSLRAVEKRFGGLRAIDGVDLDVVQGTVLGLVGPNGSGKTTLLNLVTGNLPVSAGQISFEASLLTGLPAHQITAAGIARTFQLVRVMQSMTVLENVSVAAMHGSLRLSPADAADEALRALEKVGLGPQANHSGGSLTYIDQKRVELARALACRPKLLLLDEWLAGLNPTELKSGVAMISQLAGDGITIIMIEHVMEAIHALCDRCVVMNSGRIIADETPREALSDPDVIAAYLGLDEEEMADA